MEIAARMPIGTGAEADGQHVNLFALDFGFGQNLLDHPERVRPVPAGLDGFGGHGRAVRPQNSHAPLGR